jgi:hypothetical protein
MSLNRVNLNRLVRLIRSRADIPDGKSGKARVEHEVIEAGTCMQVVTARNALLMGYRALSLRLESPFPIRPLKSHPVATLTLQF